MKQKAIKKKKAPKQQVLAYVELLQNGVVQQERAFYLHRSHRLKLGASDWCNFSLPKYPMAKPLTFAWIRKRTMILQLPGKWEGFSYNHRQSFTYDAKEKVCHRIVLKEGDGAAFYCGDLSLIFKIRALTPKKQSKTLLKFTPKLFSLLIANKYETIALAAALLLSFLVLTPVNFYLQNKNIRPPSTINDIPEKYVMPFIYPLNFLNLPEALQDSLDRSNYKNAAIQFADTMTSIWSNKPIAKKDMAFPQSIALFQSLFIKRDQKLGDIKESKRQNQEKIQQKPLGSILNISSVQGESIAGTVRRVFDKFDLLHEDLAEQLAQRRKFVTDYQNDPDYDFSNYKQGAFKQSKEAKEALSKISPFSLLSNEEEMYRKAENYAKTALRVQKEKFFDITGNSEDTLFAKRNGPIGMPVSFDGVSFLALKEFALDDSKINGLLASQLIEGVKGEMVKEPLVGQIEPNVIEGTVKKQQFELQLCYESALRKNDNLSGLMKWKWRIDTFGKISDLSLVSSSIDDKNMQACVRKKIASWNFPRPLRGSVEVKYPFVFEKNKG